MLTIIRHRKVITDQLRLAYLGRDGSLRTAWTIEFDKTEDIILKPWNASCQGKLEEGDD
jgi:hypothetical protein